MWDEGLVGCIYVHMSDFERDGFSARLTLEKIFELVNVIGLVYCDKSRDNIHHYPLKHTSFKEASQHIHGSL
jgi:hypothetical protein